LSKKRRLSKVDSAVALVAVAIGVAMRLDP
jgi:hypothetical protein